MSHTTTVNSVALVSKSAIQAAVRDLKGLGIKCDLLENATPRAYYSNQDGMGEADMVLKLNDALYDVGLYKNDKGHYEARTDFFAGSVGNVLGVEASTGTSHEQAQLGKFFQAYATRAVEEQAFAQGYMVNHARNADGTVVMTLSSAA